MAEEVTDTEKILHEGPPLSWFSGSGYKDRGILGISFSHELSDMNGGKVGKHLGEWSHFTGNPVTEDDISERIERARKAIADAEEYVIKVTGFTPRQIADKAHQLTKIFRGQKSAPFDFELY